MSTKKCGICGSEFTPARYVGYVYCSRECAGVAWARQLDLQKQAARAPVVTKKCDHCKKPFETSRPRKRFCSVDCRGKQLYQGG